MHSISGVVVENATSSGCHLGGVCGTKLPFSMVVNSSCDMTDILVFHNIINNNISNNGKILLRISILGVVYKAER